MRVTGTQSAPYANTYAYSTHINFENETHKNGGNPWYFYGNCGQSWTGVTYIPTGIDYAARFAYDSVAQGWWQMHNGVSAPTVTFLSAAYSTPIYTNHDFISWVVDNSDYRTRYEGGQWITPQVAVVMNAFAWVVDEDNVSFDLSIERQINGNWVAVYQVPSAPYSGSYICQDAGTYRAVFYYTINGVAHTYSSSSWVTT